MLALIMAGGAGRRLMAGEKPLLSVNHRPMVAWVADAFRAAGCEPVVVTSSMTPMTSNWCRGQGIMVQPSSGRGYVEDMMDAVIALGEENPLFISVSDIPCIKPDTIRTIRDIHAESGMDACSVWIPASMTNALPESMPYRENVDGIIAFPCGVNILRGDLIKTPQNEHKVLLHDRGLAINVNTPEDRNDAEEYLIARTTG